MQDDNIDVYFILQSLDAALRVSTLSADAASDPLVEFLSAVLCNSILVLKQHAFVLCEMQSIAIHKDYTSYARSVFATFCSSFSIIFLFNILFPGDRYSIVSVWIVMQSEIQKLVACYIQPSAAACESFPFLSSSSSNSSKVHT